MSGFVMPWVPLGILIGYPVYLILMAAALAACGVRRAEIAKWALRHADRHRFLDLIRAARGLPASPPDEKS